MEYNSNDYNKLVKEIEDLIKKNGFENTSLIQLSFKHNNSRELKIREENEIKHSPQCRLVRDPNTGNWKIICN